MHKPIICITGATGFIGQNLINKFSYAHYSLRVLTRKNNLKFPDHVEVFIGDLTIFDSSLKLFLDNCSIIINCAGEISNVKHMRRLHVGGTTNLLKAIVEKHSLTAPVHWVQLSSVGAYGPPIRRDLVWLVEETTPTNPVGEYEITKTMADELLMKANNEGLITCSILRPSNVFGKGMPNQSLYSLISFIRRGLFFYIGSPGAIANYVHVDDVVDGIIRCTFNPIAKGKVYILSADCMLEDLINCIALTLGKNPPKIRVSEYWLRKFLQCIGSLKFFPIKPSRINALTSRTHYSSNKILSELNFSFSKKMPNSIVDLVK